MEATIFVQFSTKATLIKVVSPDTKIPSFFIIASIMKASFIDIL